MKKCTVKQFLSYQISYSISDISQFMYFPGFSSELFKQYTFPRTSYFLLELEPFLPQTHSKTNTHFKWNFISRDSSVSLIR